ncbi:AbrB family transcriptional regulator [Cryobacterium tepidiphilum]|uniref:AbrB family transcriptional regulator n=1 Tax=Cryobacterium tepidiphilum TaxID=2486026 RepID=UPI001314A665|nr:AbrB family transcriptional regulator [Cryobacterium tepidiphilum]
MRRRTGSPRDRRHAALNALVLLAGGFAGAALLSVLHVPAGALIGSVLGSMAANKIAQAVVRRRARAATRLPSVSRALPAPVRVVGQVILGVLAGERLNTETLTTLLHSLLPVVLSVVLMLLLTMALARYLVVRRNVDPLTAVMSAAPGGISVLAITAQRQGAVMHVVLAIHLFRVLVVVLLVLPLVLQWLRAH